MKVNDVRLELTQRRRFRPDFLLEEPEIALVRPKCQASLAGEESNEGGQKVGCSPTEDRQPFPGRDALKHNLRWDLVELLRGILYGLERIEWSDTKNEIERLAVP